MKQLLVTCLLCGRGGFSVQGIRQHWCPTKPPPKGNRKHSAPLTREECQAAIEAARKEAA